MKTNVYVGGLLALLSVAVAAEETSAIASPHCDAVKIKAVGGVGVLKVETSPEPDRYVVTIDVAKTRSAEIVRKLYQAGCL